MLPGLKCDEGFPQRRKGQALSQRERGGTLPVLFVKVQVLLLVVVAFFTFQAGKHKTRPFLFFNLSFCIVLCRRVVLCCAVSRRVVLLSCQTISCLACPVLPCIFVLPCLKLNLRFIILHTRKKQPPSKRKMKSSTSDCKELNPPWTQVSVFFEILSRFSPVNL